MYDYFACMYIMGMSSQKWAIFLLRFGASLTSQMYRFLRRFGTYLQE